MGLEATASESVVDEKEEKHFHHAMGQKLHEVPFQATFRNLGSLCERKAPNGEKSSEGCVNGVQHVTGTKLVGLRLEQRGDQDWSKSVRMNDHMLVDKMKAEKIKMDPTTEIKVEAHMFVVWSIQEVGWSENLV